MPFARSANYTVISTVIQTVFKAVINIAIKAVVKIVIITGIQPVIGGRESSQPARIDTAIRIGRLAMDPPRPLP